MHSSSPLRGPAAFVGSAVLLSVLGPTPAELTRPLTTPGAWARTSPVDVAVAELAALAAWGSLAYVAVGAALVLAARGPGAAGRLAARLAGRVLPVVLRGALETALGVGLAAGASGTTALPALAQETPVSAPTASGAGPFDRPVSPPVGIDRPASPTAARPASPASPSGADRPAVVVVPGDSLWSIAAAALGGAASDAQIDRSWRRWYAANSAVVGANPDLIHPGQRLIPPASS